MATTKPTPGPYEIPNEMRDFAEKSVEQARKAFDGFLEAAHRASGTLETQASTAQENARSIGGAAVSFAESNLTASFEFAQKLARARTLEEMVQLQAEFARSQIQTLTQQLTEIGSRAVNRPPRRN